MNIKDLYNDYLTSFNAYLNSMSLPGSPAHLYEPIVYTMSLGGKRLRPVLTLMTADMFGAKRSDVLPVALSIEMFHNFTLLHDDVMDRADVRRGRPTVHRKWNDNVAILSGDTMLTLATQYLTLVPEHYLKGAIELFNRTAIEIYEGQQMDMDFEQRDDVTVAEYMEMIRLKTSVLLGAACRMGALVGGASSDDSNALYEMGVNLGLAFQLQDDLLDVWGDPEKFGKQIGGDIMCGKKTFLLITAMTEATGADRDVLAYYIGGDGRCAPREQKVTAVMSVYDNLGLRERAISSIASYSAKAVSVLSKTSLSPHNISVLSELINMLTSRES